MNQQKKKNKTQPNRLEYLSLLVNEFYGGRSGDARKQILANLANFAYDPCNFNYLRQLNVLDLFLNHLSDFDENVVQFSIGGICNLSLDPVNKDYIIQNGGISKITKLFEFKNENILISCITSLMFLITPESKEEITNSVTIKYMIKLAQEKNKRIKNLAQIFLEDYCSKEKIEAAWTSLENSVADIPLPESSYIL